MHIVPETVLWTAPLLLALLLWLAVTVHSNVWRCIHWALLAAITWLAVTFAIKFVAAAGPQDDAISFFSRSILRGLSALSEVIFSPWFLPALILVLMFKKELKTLMTRFASQAKSVEAGGVKIELIDLEAAPVAFTAQWWVEDLAGGDHSADTPAGDGAMRVRPERPTKQYLQAVAQIEEILSHVTTQNQMELGPKAKALEDEWKGEYTEYLELTLNILRQRVTTGKLENVDDIFLATCFTCRHIMLYINGDYDHAARFMADLEFLNEEHARGTLVRAMGYWFVLFLSERKHFDIARELASHPLFAKVPATAAAYKALINLKSARYDRAIEEAIRGLTLPVLVEEKAETGHLPRIVSEYVLAEAYLRSDNPDSAIRYAELVMDRPGQKPRGLVKYLKRNALRAFAFACTQTNNGERLQKQVNAYDPAAEDPYVLHALAVAQAKDGRPKLALQTLKRAHVLLPRTGEEVLRKAIESNFAALQPE